jgi:hypothetical protein
MKKLPLASALVLSLALSACGDDSSSTGSGGGGGDATTGSSASASTSGATTSSVDGSSSASGGDGGAGGGGQGGSTTSAGGGGSTSTGSVDPAPLTVSWTIAVGGTDVDCFYLGSEEVEVTVLGQDGEEPVVHTFSCFDGEGTTVPLPLGTYAVSARLLDFEQESVGEIHAFDVEVEAGGSEVSLPFDEDGAQVAASWSVTLNGEPGECADAGATHTEILLYNVASGLSYGATDLCDLYENTTPPVPLGDYEVVVSLVYEQDVVLVSSDVIVVELDQADEVVDVGEIEFAVE